MPARDLGSSFSSRLAPDGWLPPFWSLRFSGSVGSGAIPTCCSRSDFPSRRFKLMFPFQIYNEVLLLPAVLWLLLPRERRRHSQLFTLLLACLWIALRSEERRVGAAGTSKKS